MQQKIIAVIGKRPVTEHACVAEQPVGHAKEIQGLVDQVGSQVIKGARTVGLVLPAFLDIIPVPVKMNLKIHQSSQLPRIQHFLHRQVHPIPAPVMVNTEHHTLLPGQFNEQVRITGPEGKWFLYHHMLSGFHGPAGHVTVQIILGIVHAQFNVRILYDRFIVSDQPGTRVLP